MKIDKNDLRTAIAIILLGLFATVNSWTQIHGKLKATASPHNIVFTWTASTSTLSGLGYNIYLGSSSGGESSTPVNGSLLTSACSGTACTATITASQSSLILPMATVYATVAACVPNGGTTTCSTGNPEVSCTIPLASADIAPPTSLAGLAH